MSGRPIRPAEVVLGLVDPADEPEVRRLLAEDPLFRDEVARLRTTTARLEQLDRGAWRPEPPPPVRAAPPPPERRSRRLRWPALAAGGLAAAAVAAALVLTPGSRGPTSRTIALRPIGDVSGSATLTIAGNGAELRGSGMPPSGADDYYEAWLADRRGRMISMGTFRVGADGRVDAHMPVAVDLADYALVDVSLEPDDGNPVHSDTSVMRGRL
jgi:anti-sigma-K factor RskA